MLCRKVDAYKDNNGKIYPTSADADRAIIKSKIIDLYMLDSTMARDEDETEGAFLARFILNNLSEILDLLSLMDLPPKEDKG